MTTEQIEAVQAAESALTLACGRIRAAHKQCCQDSTGIEDALLEIHLRKLLDATFKLSLEFAELATACVPSAVPVLKTSTKCTP